jgi:hypothetical protein
LAVYVEVKVGNQPLLATLGFTFLFFLAHRPSALELSRSAGSQASPATIQHVGLATRRKKGQAKGVGQKSGQRISDWHGDDDPLAQSRQSTVL